MKPAQNHAVGSGLQAGPGGAQEPVKKCANYKVNHKGHKGHKANFSKRNSFFVSLVLFVVPKFFTGSQAPPPRSTRLPLLGGLGDLGGVFLLT
jgi:hypothetical protein